MQLQLVEFVATRIFLTEVANLDKLTYENS
jgi:hypothetical protein